jgi:hypothetical protein
MTDKISICSDKILGNWDKIKLIGDVWQGFGLGRGILRRSLSPPVKTGGCKSTKSTSVDSTCLLQYQGIDPARPVGSAAGAARSPCAPNPAVRTSLCLIRCELPDSHAGKGLPALPVSGATEPDGWSLITSRPPDERYRHLTCEGGFRALTDTAGELSQSLCGTIHSQIVTDIRD